MTTQEHYSMATSQDRPPKPKPVFTVFEDEADSLLEDQPDGCGFLRSFPCFGSTREQASGPGCTAWIGKRAKSVREFSEVVAGPKWKNFVRKVGGYLKNNKRRGFQYDSFDYALNFDDGLNYEEEHERLDRGFSARFVADNKLNGSRSTT